jgi:hypothetical protein
LGEDERRTTMKIRTHIKAGGRFRNHNEAVACGSRTSGLRVRSQLKAAGRLVNHNETLSATSR